MWAVGAIGPGTTLIAAAMMPAEPDPFVEEASVIIPAPGSFVRTTGIAVKRCTTSDVATPLVISVGGTSPARDALWPAGAGVPIVAFAGFTMVVVGW